MFNKEDKKIKKNLRKLFDCENGRTNPVIGRLYILRQKLSKNQCLESGSGKIC